MDDGSHIATREGSDAPPAPVKMALGDCLNGLCLIVSKLQMQDGSLAARSMLTLEREDIITLLSLEQILMRQVPHAEKIRQVCAGRRY